jgi:hypothetical protein
VRGFHCCPPSSEGGPLAWHPAISFRIVWLYDTAWLFTSYERSLSIHARTRPRGPSYPQGIALGAADVVGTGLKAGMYVVATNNKEDVWLAHVDLADL